MLRPTCPPAAFLALLFLTVFLSGPLEAAPEPAQGRFRIYLLTVDPGAEIYSSWGHTALRIDDALSGQQLVFDYGVFRFDATFLFRFLKGDPHYMLGVTTWARTAARYRARGRRIRAQQLLLSPAEAEGLARHLAVQAQPENRRYVYNHFTNNCTTVYRDHVDRALGGSFLRGFADRPSGRTLRAITTEPLHGKPLLRLGVHLILNGVTDAPATVSQEMFLPEALLRHLDEARTAKRIPRERIGSVETLLEESPERTAERNAGRPVAPGILVGVLALVLLGALSLPQPEWRRRAYRTAFVGWCAAAGAIGLVIFLLNTFSTFTVFHHNLNLFGFHPLLALWPLADRLLGARRRPRARLILHAALLSGPIVGLTIAISNYSIQYSEPFLGAALLVQITLMVAAFRNGDFRAAQPEQSSQPAE